MDRPQYPGPPPPDLRTVWPSFPLCNPMPTTLPTDLRNWLAAFAAWLAFETTVTPPIPTRPSRETFA